MSLYPAYPLNLSGPGGHMGPLMLSPFDPGFLFGASILAGPQTSYNYLGGIVGVQNGTAWEMLSSAVGSPPIMESTSFFLSAGVTQRPFSAPPPLGGVDRPTYIPLLWGLMRGFIQVLPGGDVAGPPT